MYNKLEKCSITNGKGIRAVIWTQGCGHNCDGCQNKETWCYDNGKLFSDEDKQKLFRYLALPYVDGVTFSGGDPLYDKNLDDVISLCREIKEKFPTKNIWLYTGYIYEELFDDFKEEVLQYIDVLVDGKYIKVLRDITLPFRGSSNQRIIDVPKSLEKGYVVIKEID